jgi:hypothetical protein
MNTNYRGIILVGPTGSGKTTLAAALHPYFPDSIQLEASEVIIKPAMAMKALPSTIEDFVAKLSTIETNNQPINRENARHTFLDISKGYGLTGIAKIVEKLHETKYHGQFLMLSGLRGYENINYLKEHGYFVVYINLPKVFLMRRTAHVRHISLLAALKDYIAESRLYKHSMSKKLADVVIEAKGVEASISAKRIADKIIFRECIKCMNSTLNPSITIEASGLCSLCSLYEKNFNKDHLKGELDFVTSCRGTGEGEYDVVVGISGGKDSTATLQTVKELGFKPLAVTFDIGYYPEHIAKRSAEVALKMGVPHKVIDIRKYIRPEDIECYKKTADLYDEPESIELAHRFRHLYEEGRKHYSAKSTEVMPYVRTCQLCRRAVIRAYYDTARNNGVKMLILGINEWAGLSQNAHSDEYTFSALRTLKPYEDQPEVHIVHLPFLLQRTITDVEIILEKLGWETPEGEQLVESNSNSCLFAKAAEGKARRMLGFHPDTTRLSREVTVGFITKEQARKALEKDHPYSKTVREVLQEAEII